MNFFTVATTVIFGIGLVTILYVVHRSRQKQEKLRDSMTTMREAAQPLDKMVRRRKKTDLDLSEIRDRIKIFAKSQKTLDNDIKTRLFRAGFYRKEDVKIFRQVQVLFGFYMGAMLVLIMNFAGDASMARIMAIPGFVIGLLLPENWLERRIRQRADECLYFLPLVIEQIAIGVSSSLDIFSSMNEIIRISRERDSFNPVSELFISVERYIRSGLSLDEALEEVGQMSGVQEIRHALRYLSQCSKHGGEVSKQLEELASATMLKKQLQIEGKLSVLPTKATGPLFLVFAGFMALMLSGLFMRLQYALAPPGAGL